MSVSFKEAAINWILTHGEVAESMSSLGTAEALYKLSKTGIDYENSTAPYFGDVVSDHGDTDNGATYVKGISATIIPLGAEYPFYSESFDFIISQDEFNGMLLSVVIAGVVENSDGVKNWRERDPEAFARIKEREDRDDAREIARQEALAARFARPE